MQTGDAADTKVGNGALMRLSMFEHCSLCFRVRMIATEPKPRDFYGFSHMNARGNLMIARLLAATLPALLQRSSS